MPANFMEELRHYWSGTKLLGYEIRICMGLIRQITKGHTLTRRERRQLMRTATDLLRLVPFAFFLIIPFMEFALPFALKLFPNMLPSTFHSKLKQEEQSKKELKAKIEVAKFLQEALFSHARTLDSSDKAETFQEFMQQVRDGIPVDNQQILRFASLFEDEFTLDQLSRDQLVAMAKYMQLNTLGTDAFLRYQLNRKISQLKKDDQAIESEGLDTLTLSELQQACSARGLKSTSRSKQFLRERLREWLDLSLKQNLPGTLLILANAFKITGTTQTKDALRDAMYHLPHSLVDDIRLKIAEDEGSLSKELKLELLKREEEQIKEEKKEGVLTDEQIKFKELQEWIGKEQDIAQSSVSFSAAQLKAITEAVADLAAKSSVNKEKRQLQELKALLEKRKAELIESEEAEKLEEATRKELEEKDKKARESSPDMEEPQPEKEEKETTTEETTEEEEKRKQEEEKKRKQKEKVIRIGDKLESYVDALQNSAEEMSTKDIHVLLGLDKDRDGKIDMEELKDACKSYREHLPSELVEHVVKRLDGDNDNKITLEELRDLANKYDSGFVGIIEKNQPDTNNKPKD
eukprot:CAMPEP_0206205528 /NCGR_PEP_ID=MMETSP0166-20121206/14284_1 /ASSEMBLY_ACC=CAM_ASM_000260 /TAXON_ID=95228 /ORGANISM="Vannella robusta, Strain DIVA3 518/3/11/1/6" /LENGTH=576 /DNA_ID=CAMNT_0053625585 /DNA_START=315 /DNA_END=2042 /DNA_ORIENTATION=-